MLALHGLVTTHLVPDRKTDLERLVMSPYTRKVYLYQCRIGSKRCSKNGFNVRKRKNGTEIDNLGNYLLQLAISYHVVCLGETRVSKDVSKGMPK